MAKKKQFKSIDTAIVDEVIVKPEPSLPVKLPKGFWRRIWEKLTLSTETK